ncbi:hypothetical protein CXG81DRAFT_6843, partial [Caulochytrium protostelioides]
NLLSRWFFLWVAKLVWLCHKAENIHHVAFTLRESETAQHNGDRMEAAWQSEMARHPQDPSLIRVLFHVYGIRFVMLGLWKLVWAACTWLGSYMIIGYLISYADSGVVRTPVGFGYALALWGSTLAATVCYHQLSWHCTRIGIQVRAGLIVLVYRKSLRVSYVRGGVGDIVNLISYECNRIAEAAVNLHLLWGAIMECLLVCTLVCVDLGVSGLPSFGLIFLIFLPAQIYLGIRASRLSNKTTDLVTKRVNLISEILSAMKLIKYYALEPVYGRKVAQARRDEMIHLKRALAARTAGLSVIFIAPVLSTLICLVTYIHVRHVGLPATETFRLLAVFNTLRYPLAVLPTSIRAVNGAGAALDRLLEFFILDEVEDLASTILPPPPPRDENEAATGSSMVLKLTCASFSWDGDIEHPHLEDLDLTLYRGRIIAVVGDIASGKSLLAAIMGQIKPVSGKFEQWGRCGYVPQEPWLLSETIQDNITFGLAYDEKRYNDVIRVTGLKDDFMVMTNGDHALVDDVFLTGAQRQKISLARCYYADPDIVLLEDCLIDFDQKMAKRMFKDCIRTMARHTAVVLVTQQKWLLPACDDIIVVKNGHIVERGAYLDLKARKINFSGWVSDFDPIVALQQHEQQQKDERALDGMMMQPDAAGHRRLVSMPVTTGFPIGATDGTGSDGSTSPSQRMDASQLTTHSIGYFDIGTMTDTGTMQLLQGPEPRRAYDYYLRVSTGSFFSIVAIAVFVMTTLPRFLSDVWLRWAVERHGTLIWLTSKKSVALHNRVMKMVLHAPMSFYEATPLGQILANFTRHLFLVDDFLPEVLMQVLSIAPLMLGTLVLLSVVIPWFWATLPVYLVAGWFGVMYGLEADTKLKSLEAANKIPMLSHLSVTLEGLLSIRLYGAQDRFDAYSRQLVDGDHKALYSLMLVRIAYAMALDSVACFLVLMAAVFAVTFHISASDMGLALTNALQLLLFIQWTLRMAGDLHVSMASIASVVWFGNHIPKEIDIIKTSRPDAAWPHAGAIEFRQVSLRYGRLGPAILKGVSFKIAPAEKIGVVGKKGSGKSTLLVALERIVDVDEGDILIDDVDIATLGVRDVRTKLGIVPDDPVLLSGTLRSNLDPYQVKSDEAIWSAIKAVHLGEKIRHFPRQLETTVSEKGKSFSLAERQLFCLARALLFRHRIVIYDEPAMADAETDQLIQAVIREHFTHVTVMILTTRFHLIDLCDRIMVLHNGRVEECDTPAVLLENPRSKFSRMIHQSDVDVDSL